MGTIVAALKQAGTYDVSSDILQMEVKTSAN